MIDDVFSIGAKYASSWRAARLYADHAGLQQSELYSAYYPVDVRPRSLELCKAQRVMARLGSWFDRNGVKLGLITAGLVVGMLAGWWAGSFLACSRISAGCEVRADSIGAAGTWFGSIGTIAAVLTAVAAFRSDERTKAEIARRQALSAKEKEALYLKEAALVSAKCSGYHTQGGKVRSYSVSVTNGADTTSMFRLSGSDFTGPLRKEHELRPGKTSTTDRRMGQWTPPPNAMTVDEFERWCLEGVSVAFKMNDLDWTLKGDGTVSRS